MSFDSPPEIAALLSRAFLASPVFAGIDDERYSAARIEPALSRGEQLLAYEDNTLIGAVTLFPPNPNSPCKLFRMAPQLGLLGVEPAQGGRGVGSALISSLEALARSRGYVELALSVSQRASQLQQLYTARGYETVAEFHWPDAADPSFILLKALG